MGVYQQSSRTPQNGVNGSRKIAPPKRSLRMRRRVKMVLFFLRENRWSTKQARAK